MLFLVSTRKLFSLSLLHFIIAFLVTFCDASVVAFTRICIAFVVNAILIMIMKMLLAASLASSFRFSSLSLSLSVFVSLAI